MGRRFYDEYDYCDENKKQVVKTVENTLSREEINEIADKVVNLKVDNKTIFGYITQDASGKPYFCKWDKDSEVFVKYFITNGKLTTVSRKTKSFREYNGDKAAEYFDEIQ